MTSIFLSYARGDEGEPFNPATSFVARLYRDLTAAGFDVWFDRVSMPSRSLTFHQEIRDAVAARDRLLLVVGPKAVESLYVRQEWQFAYFEAEKIVTPILRQGDYGQVPDELKLLHCEEFRDDAQYDFHFKNLIRQLAEPAPPLGKLIAVPSLPPHFLSRTDRLTALRDALRADLDRPVVITGAAARVGMHGMGGIGKSVLAATLSRDRKVREAFPDGIVWVGLGSLPTVADLQRRVHKDLGGDGAFQTEHEGRVKLREILKDKSVLLILDDVWRREDVDWFDVLGPRCRAMITTRDSGLLTSLGGVHHQVELLTDAEALNLLAQAAGVERDKVPNEAADLIAECGRLPLAVALCGGLIRHGFAWAKVLEQLRTSRIDRIKDPHAAKVEHESIWNAIDVSVKFLSADEQARFLELAVFPPDEATPIAAIQTLWSHTAGFDDWDTDALVIKFSQRSLLTLATVDGQTRVELHDLIHDYLRHALPDLRPLHETLLAAYGKRCRDGWASGPNDGYFFTHFREHLIGAGRAAELPALVRDHGWLEAKAAFGVVADLIADIAAARQAFTGGTTKRRSFREVEAMWRELPFCAGVESDLPPELLAAQAALEDDAPENRFLQLVEEAMRRELPFLARHPTALFQCLWNSCWWYDCPEAEAHYEPAPRPRPILSPWMRDWRAAKEKAGHFAWVRSQRPPTVPLGGPMRAICTGHSDGVTTLAFSPCGRVLATGSWDHTARLWDRKTGIELACLKHASGACGFENWVDVVAFSPDGRTLATASNDKTAYLWDPETGRELACLRGHEGDVVALAFSPDGRAVATSSEDKTARLWDRETGHELACLRGHGGTVMALAFSPDGRTLATASHDKTARLWDRETGRELACLRGDGRRVVAVAFSPDGLAVATGSEDLMPRLWNLETGRELACLPLSLSEVFEVAFAPDGSTLAIVSGDNTVRLWDRATDRERARLRGHVDLVRAMAFSPDGRVLATGSNDKTARLWDTETGRMLACLRGHENIVFALAFSPDGRVLATASRDNTARLWDLESGRDGVRLYGHDSEVEVLEFSLDGRVLATGSNDNTARLWDTETGRMLACLRGHEGHIVAVAFAPDGRALVTGSEDHTARLWGRETGRELACLRGHGGTVRSLAFAPDGRILATGADHDTVRVWDRETGKELTRLHLPDGHCWPHVLGFSPEGLTLVVRVLTTFCVYEPGVGEMSVLAFSLEGRLLWGEDSSGRMHLWEASTGWRLPGKTEPLTRASFPSSRSSQVTAARSDGELVFIPAGQKTPIAWFPASPSKLATADGLTWAVSSDSEVYLLRLEGVQADAARARNSWTV